MLEHQIKTTKNIKSLVLSGGGFRGISYVGLLKYLEENNIVDNIEQFVGSSIGSLICFFINIGYDSKELEKIGKVIFPNFYNYQTINIDSILNILNTYGLEEGKKINQLIKRLIIIKGFSPFITFKELFLRTNKKLVITATNLNNKKGIIISHETFPDLMVITGLEMTTRIPILFYPVKYKNDYIVDGGVTNNFAINQVIDKSTMLGVYVRGNNVITNFSSFVNSILDTFINLQPNNNRNNDNCFNIELYNIEVYSDKISNETIDLIINEGYQQTKNYFET